MSTSQFSVPEERQNPLHAAIANELIALTPEWWDAARLTVSVEHDEGTTERPHEITSPDGHQEPVVPGDDLFLLTRQLYLLSQEFGRPWKRVSYEVRLLPEGAWNYVFEVAYD